MSHRSQKVYPDSATQAGIASSSQSAPVPPNGHQGFFGSFRKRDLVLVAGGLANITTLIILIFTLLAYQRANELNREAMLLAHTPWLSIQPKIQLYPIKDDKELIVTFEVQNCSDTPILALAARCMAFDASKPPDKAVTFKDLKLQTNLMPRDSDSLEDIFTTSPQAVPSFSAQELQNSIRDGHTCIRVAVTYDDVFRNHYSEFVDLRWDPQRNGFDAVRAEVTGYPTF